MMAIQNAIGRLGTHQSVAFSTTAGTIANPISSQCYKIRVVVSSAANILIGNNPTATAANGTLLPANQPEYFICSPGESVSAIGAAAGTLDVTEIA
jgi:hypothetical protein